MLDSLVRVSRRVDLTLFHNIHELILLVNYYKYHNQYTTL